MSPSNHDFSFFSLCAASAERRRVGCVAAAGLPSGTTGSILTSPRRLRSGSVLDGPTDQAESPVDIDRIVDAVIGRQTVAGILGGGSCGTAGGIGTGADGGFGAGASGGSGDGCGVGTAVAGAGAAPARGGAGGSGAVKLEHDEDSEPSLSPSRRRLWLQELREQLTASSFYGIREREKVRALPVICEGWSVGTGAGCACS